MYALPNSHRTLITSVIRKLLASSSMAVAETFKVLKGRLETLKETTRTESADESIDFFLSFFDDDEIETDDDSKQDELYTREKVNEFIKNINSKLIGTLDRDEIVVVAEENKKTVLESFPESNMAKEYEILADNLLKSFGYKISKDKKLREYNKDADDEQPSNPDTKEEAKC